MNQVQPATGAVEFVGRLNWLVRLAGLLLATFGLFVILLALKPGLTLTSSDDFNYAVNSQPATPMQRIAIGGLGLLFGVFGWLMYVARHKVEINNVTREVRSTVCAPFFSFPTEVHPPADFTGIRFNSGDFRLGSIVVSCHRIWLSGPTGREVWLADFAGVSFRQKPFYISHETALDNARGMAAQVAALLQVEVHYSGLQEH